MNRRSILKRLFEQNAIAFEAVVQARAAYLATSPTDSAGLVAAFATLATCLAVYRRADDRYKRALAAVASGDLAAQLEASLEVVS